VPCRCPDGAASYQACELNGFFSLCACGLFGAQGVGGIDWSRPPPAPHTHGGSSGVGLLIGGLVTFGLGTASLITGIALVAEDTVVPLGIVLTATGGTAMAVGIPLGIVGLVNVAQGDERGYYSAEAPASEQAPAWSVGPGGLRVAF
jgi:hypothetical protein